MHYEFGKVPFRMERAVGNHGIYRSKRAPRGAKKTERMIEHGNYDAHHSRRNSRPSEHAQLILPLPRYRQRLKLVFDWVSSHKELAASRC
jgi:hypothetical protein